MQFKIPFKGSRADGVTRIKQMLSEHAAQIKENASDVKTEWNDHVLSVARLIGVHLFNIHFLGFLLAPFMFFGSMFSHASYTPPVASSTDPVACTMEAKLCPDGSYVGRSGPNCEFAACPTAASSTPHRTVSIASLSPVSGVIGTSVTIKGSGLMGDNTVKFGSGVIVHVVSKSYTSLTFTVPSSLTPACFYSEPRYMVMSRLTTPGVYAVVVQNARGTSNALNFTVTDGTPPQQTTISIQSIKPPSGPVGTEVMMCPMYLQLVTPGTYKVYVENENGSTNTVEFTVTGAGTLE